MKPITLFLLLELIVHMNCIHPSEIVYYIPPYDNNINGKLNNDSLFLDLEEPSGQYTGMRVAFFRLKEALHTLQIPFKLTSPHRNLSDALFIIDHDRWHPANENSQNWFSDILKYPREKLILLMGEPESVLPFNFHSCDTAKVPLMCWPDGVNSDIASLYGNILTWYDDWSNQKLFKKIYYPQPILKMIHPCTDFDKKKLCVLIAGDKKTWHPKSGYAARREWVNFCIANNVEFDLYGGYNWYNWNSENPLYKGPVPLSTELEEFFPKTIARGLKDKINLIKKYKFYLCYENEIATNGWITEKIFDCFIAGCVPIYLGSPNIAHFIPANCFIDRLAFNSDKDLLDYITSMSREKYEEYIQNIANYLRSDAAQLFSVEYFVHTLLETIFPNYCMMEVFNEDELMNIARSRKEAARLIHNDIVVNNHPVHLHFLLWLALIEKNNAQALQILEKNASVINMRLLPFDKMTLLHWFAHQGDISAVSFLLLRGADTQLLDEKKMTASDRARTAHHEEILALIESKHTSDRNGKEIV